MAAAVFDQMQQTVKPLPCQDAQVGARRGKLDRGAELPHAPSQPSLIHNVEEPKTRVLYGPCQPCLGSPAAVAQVFNAPHLPAELICQRERAFAGRVRFRHSVIVLSTAIFRFNHNDVIPDAQNQVGLGPPEARPEPSLGGFGGRIESVSRLARRGPGFAEPVGKDTSRVRKQERSKYSRSQRIFEPLRFGDVLRQFASENCVKHGIRKA